MPRVLTLIISRLPCVTLPLYEILFTEFKVNQNKNKNYVNIFKMYITCVKKRKINLSQRSSCFSLID